MTHLSRCIVMAVLAAYSVHAEPRIASEPSGEIRPVAVEITGRGFEIRVLRNNTIAFKTRSYLWSEVPAALEGLRYTQMLGGGTATIHLKAKEAGRVFVAIVANQMLGLKEQGWTLPVFDRSNTFTYSDAAQTLMVILSHPVTEGQELDVPQLGFAGTIVLLPVKPKRLDIQPPI
jgi:hypothetical protein